MPRTMTDEREAAIRKSWVGGAAAGTALLAELDAERAESQWLQSILLNLLAVIHQDGGHYSSEYGIDKSAKDAMQLSADRIGRVEALEGLLRGIVVEIHDTLQETKD